MTRQARIRPGHRWPASKPDIRRMPFHERSSLLSVAPVAIITGSQYACSLPIALFRAVSKRDREIDTHHPYGPALFLPEVETWTIVEVVRWVQQLCEEENYAKLSIMRDSNGDLCTFRDLSLLRAGTLLGMNLYFNEIYEVYAKHFKGGDVSVEDVDGVVRLALKKDDAFLRFVGTRLGELVRSGGAAEVFPGLGEYLADHPWLKYWVNKELEGEGCELANEGCGQGRLD